MTVLEVKVRVNIEGEGGGEGAGFVADLFEGRLVADTAGEAELVPVGGGGAVVQAWGWG